MLMNVSDFIDFAKSLMDEYNEQLLSGKKPSQIKIRIDCVLKRIIKDFGTVVKGSVHDNIIEVDF